MSVFTVPNTKPTAQGYAGQVQADLASNARFKAWRQGAADILGDPHKFGIDYLPKGAWIDKQGNVVTTDTGIPTAAKLLPIAGLTLGAMTLPGLPLAAATGSHAAAAGTAATTTGALAPTIPGSVASTAYGAGMFAAPSATAATLASATPAAGAGMKFGLGSLAKFFNSSGGSQAIDAAGQLIGGAMQTRGNNHAADVQGRAAQQALDFAKQQYADAVKNYAPFLQASQNALPQLTDFMNQTRPPQGGYPIDGSMVTMRSPTGQVKQIPANDVPHYRGLGAQVMA